MKLISYKSDNQATFGAVTGNGVVELRNRLEPTIHDLKSFMDSQPDLGQVANIIAGSDEVVSLDDVEFLPVIPNPGAIFCMGMNTHSHVDEVARVTGQHKVPQKPSLFMRLPRTQVGHRQALEKPNGSPLFDYEGEIAMVIGKLGRHIPVDEAPEYIAGYTCYNDASVRDYQLHSHMFTSGKNFPRTGGFGPWLVTSDEVGDSHSLSLMTRVNGIVVQTMAYEDLIYGFEEIVAYVSEFSELHPGDVIVTGSPAGSALFSNPRRWLQTGDVVDVEVSGVGTLRNSIEPAQGMNQAPITRADADEAFLEALAYARNR